MPRSFAVQVITLIMVAATAVMAQPSTPGLDGVIVMPIGDPGGIRIVGELDGDRVQLTFFNDKARPLAIFIDGTRIGGIDSASTSIPTGLGDALTVLHDLLEGKYELLKAGQGQWSTTLPVGRDRYIDCYGPFPLVMLLAPPYTIVGVLTGRLNEVKQLAEQGELDRLIVPSAQAFVFDILCPTVSIVAGLGGDEAVKLGSKIFQPTLEGTARILNSIANANSQAALEQAMQMAKDELSVICELIIKVFIEEFPKKATSEVIKKITLVLDALSRLDGVIELSRVQFDQLMAPIHAGFTLSRGDPRVMLDVPYYIQGNTEWCIFASAAMMLGYYRPSMTDQSHASKLWELASEYGKAPNQSWNAWNVLSDDLAAFINSIEPGLRATRDTDFIWMNELHSWLEQHLRLGHPVLVARGGSFEHSVIVTGFGPGGVWINNPGPRPQLPFINGSGAQTFLTWEEFEVLFVKGAAPRYLVYCQGLAPITNADGINIANLGIGFRQQSNPMVGLSELVLDGRSPNGYRWDGPYAQALPQEDVAVMAAVGIGNSCFNRLRRYNVSLQVLDHNGKVAYSNNWQTDQIMLGSYVELSLKIGEQWIPIPATIGGLETLRFVLYDESGDELDRMEFQYVRELAEAKSAGMLDCVFCIDTTGSMMDDIEEVKKTAVETIDAMREYCATNNISLQVGLVTYQDHSDAEQFAGKPEAQWLRAWPMSSTPEVIVSNIRAITINTAGAGGDVAEDFYAAAMCAMDARGDWQDKPVAMGWRSGAAKIFIPMADAPPHDPDFEGRTMSVVVNRADELDPVHVYPIVIQGPVESWLLGTQKAMTNLAEHTGGQVTHVSKAEELPPALVKTVKLAVRRHRHEVWRKEHPPYALYIMALVIGLVVIFAFVGVFIAQFRRQPEQAMRRS